jgi:hypothetical protein
MATTKWLDPSGWTLADWEDDTLTVLVDYLWAALKGAADERQAYSERGHSGSFDADYTFPDFSDLKNLFNSSASSPNNAKKIEFSTFPYIGGSAFGANPHANYVIETDTIEADGTAITSAEAKQLTLFRLLDDLLGYTTIFDHIEDTSNGLNTALLRKVWVTQWFQVMDYPKYIHEPFRPTAGTALFSVVETQDLFMEVSYDYSTASGFLGASAFLTVNGGSPVDKYTTNDLKESAPFSNSQAVYDYTYGILNTQKSTAAWITTTTNPNFEVSQQVQNYTLSRSPTNEYHYQINMREKRIRFKPNDAFRATSPDKYATLIHKYFYLTEISGTIAGLTATFNAFGGPAEDTSKFTNITVDGDGYFYLNTVADYSTFTVPADPADLGIIQAREGNDFQTLDDVSLWGVLSEVNNTDGTAFEYYTP